MDYASIPLADDMLRVALGLYHSDQYSQIDREGKWFLALSAEFLEPKRPGRNTGKLHRESEGGESISFPSDSF